MVLLSNIIDIQIYLHQPRNIDIFKRDISRYSTSVLLLVPMSAQSDLFQ